ncbi:hypothetical protein FGO68_gene6356 [Halteria grandinella]|uniref:Uncharacterized protein n=1 Tax=Halteria grandinella TaxID=5974 RepID=A0A8J8NDS0_HALGN|nr:hypothetical protein FGO68_gene6356 [Halteria grandinella]
MQREKERLHRYFQSKERTQKVLEDIEKRGKELLKKKEVKLAKIEEKQKKELKEYKHILVEKDFKRQQKMKVVEDKMKDLIMRSEEEYLEHLEQVRQKQEERDKRQKEWCELEYKRHNESMNRSMNNYQQAIKERQQLELVTERNLQDLQRRLSIGWNRSQVRKEELRQHAAETLNNFHSVLENHEKIELEMATERLSKFFDRRNKQLKHFQKWEKERAKSMENTKFKAESKLGAAKHLQQQALDELERLGENIQERFKEHAQRMEEFKQKRERDFLLKHEREQLRFEDQQSNLQRQKRQKEREKLQVIQKHMQIESKMQQFKETKAHLLEYHRVANELRLNSSVMSK